MAGELAGRFDRRPAPASASTSIGPRPKQPQRPAGRGDDGRFEAALGRAGVDDQRDSPAEALQHMLGAGRADRAAGVGRRRGERPPDRAQQRLHRRMRGNAKADGRQAGGDDRGDAGVRRAAERPASAGPANAASASARAPSSKTPMRSAAAKVGNMNDQRVEARSSLGFVDAGDSFGVGRVGGEAVDRLGRRPRPARRRGSAARLRRCVIAEGKDPRLHADAARRIPLRPRGSTRRVRARSGSAGSMPRRLHPRADLGPFLLEEPAALGIAQPRPRARRRRTCRRRA